jgi:hypothetical protein
MTRSVLVIALCTLAAPASAQLSRAALPCGQPELWLSEYPMEEIQSAYCSACADRCIDGRMRWRLLSDARGASCRELDYAAIAIGAARGERVVDPYWRAYFEAQPWYRPGRPQWTPVARESQRSLETAAQACWTRDPAPAISPRIRRQIARWFAGARRGRAALPSVVYLNGERSDGAGLRALLASAPPFTPRASIRAVLDPLSPIAGPLTYDVDTRASISCVEVQDEACDRSVQIELRFDREGRLDALHVSLFG